MEDGYDVKSKDAVNQAVDLFYSYYNDPKFSTMIALTDSRGNNLVFYDSDKNAFYSNRLQ